MEELQSTEILDQEILKDAQKKAFKILKSADDTIKVKSGEWEKKTAEALEELEKKFLEQRRLAGDETAAILPMDKRRVKAERIENLLRSAVETWYAGLSRDKVLDILKKEMAKRLAVCGGFNASQGQCVLHKLTRAEAEALLKEILPGVRVPISGTCDTEETQSVTHQKCGAYPEFILENHDVRIYASVNKTIDFFLREKRDELAKALLSKASLGDGSAEFTGDAL